MADIVVRRLGTEVKDSLKRRAKKHGRSLEAEARAILSAAAEGAAADLDTPAAGESFGELMLQRFGRRGLTHAESERFKAGIGEINSTWESGLPDFFD